MIPEPTESRFLSVNQKLLANQITHDEVPSKEDEFVKELFASLNQHVTKAQQLSNKELFSLLPVFEEDCSKVHDLCQKILKGEISGTESLGKMSTLLSQMVAQLENAEKTSPSKINRDVLKHLRTEINEIHETIQLKTSLDLREKLQSEFEMQDREMPLIEEAMKPLSGWHFQNLDSQSNLESTSSTWKLNNLRNITLAGLLYLGSSGPKIRAPTVNELELMSQGTWSSHIMKPVNTSTIPEPMAKVDVVIHTRPPLASAQVRALQQEVALARRALSSTSSFTALPEWPHQVDNTCYEIAGFEQSIGRLMNEARQFLSQEDQEAAKCGNKHLNLIKQAQLVEGLKLDGIVVLIPHGVSSDRVTQFLQKLVGEMFDEWAKLGALYKNYKGTSPFLEDTEALKHLKAIDQMIEKAFQAAGDNIVLFQELVTPEFQQWLDTIKNSNHHLMVRSTGSEDSRETANAGGNISRNYVSPNAAALSKAMGDVVRSYFSYSSLQNRINAKLNPFESELKMAVTVQELIGEPIGGSLNPADIPISLVLFSSEPLYVGGEKFRAMRMSGTYGHGEGVVGNQGIATDTVLILISEAHPDKLYILYDNEMKPERLAPIMTPDGIKLGKVSNPPSMQNRRVFDETLLHRLYLWGVLGEKFFDNHPTDMEIVIKGKTIFPVQARPVNRPDLMPTYIDLKKVTALSGNPIIQKVQGEVIVPGLGSVVMIEKPEELMFTSTLEEAEKTFQKNLHKAVVATRPEPANSHPVVNFSGLGVPCLVASQGIQELLSQVDEEHLIAIDMQTGVLSLWDKSQGAIDDFISKGFAVHPAKIAISLPLAANILIRHEGQQVPQDIKDLILEIRSATTQEVANAKLKELRQHGWLQNVKQMEQELKTHLKNMEFVPRQLWQGLTLTTQLIEKINEAFEEAEVVFAKKSQDRLHPLLHAKVLESLLVTSFQTKKSLSQYSVMDIVPLHKDLKALVDYQKNLSHPAHFADLFMMGSQGVVPESEVEWRTFLKDLEPLVQSGKISQEQVVQFKQLIGTLETTEMLPTWYALFFPKISRTDLAPQEKFYRVLETLPAKDAPFIYYFLNLHQSLKANEGKIDLFNHPKSFEHGWIWLQNQVNQFNSKATIGGLGSLFAQLRVSSPVSKMLALKVMQELVDTYDLSIKAMKASSAWSKEEQVALFKRMLEPYLNLLMDWGKNINPEIDHSDYLEEMEQIFKDLPDNNPEHLIRSIDFSVDAAMIGSEVDTTKSTHYSPRI